jgi:hypothetical protein
MLVVRATWDAYTRHWERGLPISTKAEAMSERAGVRTGSFPDRVRAPCAWGFEKMSTSLVWRALLFFGLTAGYVIVAALPYLA